MFNSEYGISNLIKTKKQLFERFRVYTKQIYLSRVIAEMLELVNVLVWSYHCS